jgi:hypothetical protein
LVPHNEKVVGKTYGIELESVFKEPNVLNCPLSNCIDSLKVVIVFPEVNVLPSVLEMT